MIKRGVAIGLFVFAAFLELGTVIGHDPIGTKIGLTLFAALIFAGSVWLWRSEQAGSQRRRVANEQQRLLSLVSDAGTLSAPRVIAELGITKEEADEALTRLRKSGLAEFDVDESGAPVYRVNKEVLAVRARKGW